ncbi:digestive organ expansion factor homolog [Drosophila hydei]|uniref:U3 small nucleolar RNA-associated protein 25 homolog n=1 Tax=Drosophila hydei TaxID=7224 RepID=A0A6J1M4K1_DROHY|nr:digestive organ expansion factor homolog [Drosophila hydei]
MKMKEKRKHIGLRPKRNNLRKDKKPANNHKFIQRSRQMEQMHRTESQYQGTIDDGSKLTADLLPLLNDETQFYEQLVSGYSSTITVPTVKHEEKCILQETKIEEDDMDQIPSDSTNLKQVNVFTNRFDFELESEDISAILAKDTNELKGKWSAIGNFKIEKPNLKSTSASDDNYKQPADVLKATDLQLLKVQMSLTLNVSYPLSTKQTELFHMANSYLDLYYPQRTHDNAEEIRYVYCLHTVNHILKSRALILRNNEKINELVKNPKQPTSEMSLPDSVRDQGLTRMKALIILPFRDSALKTVQIISKLLFENRKDPKTGYPVTKYERFLKEYSGNTVYFPKTNPKPPDYEQTFNGNTDDNFKIGIRLTKKSMSLYTDFSGSDILLASPLALRMIINDKDQDFDFLNSIELLIIDQAELLIAQNWENLLQVLDHLHLQPQKLPETNCQRLRSYCLNATSRFYRQTLLFSSHDLPEFRGVINNKCHNFQGKVRIINKIESGFISNVLTPIKQVFQRIDCSSMESALEDRFQHFVRYILPQFTKSGHSHCLLYVPSYFDYVRLRNHFKKEMINFVQISEYSKKEKISRARDIFFHSGAPFMLYSERGHFFRRTRIKGIRHLIFYQPPNFPNFYPELINFMLDINQNPRDGLQDIMSVKVLYTKFDLLSLSNIIGNENAWRLTTGASDSYLFSNNE